MHSSSAPVFFNIFWVFFFAAVIIGIPLLCIACRHRNQSMRNQTARYRSAVQRADEAARKANSQLADIARLVANPAAAAAQADRLSIMCDYYQKLYSAAAAASDAAEALHREAYRTYRSGVHKQNIFFGGASDLSYLFWHRIENEFFDIARSVRLTDPSMVLVSASLILTAAKERRSAASAAGHRIADRRDTPRLHTT